MAATKTPLAPDSAAELHDLIGDDATATFESDPKFIDSNPTDNSSSEHIEVQRDTDDTADSEEEEEDEEEEELEDDDDDELEDEYEEQEDGEVEEDEDDEVEEDEEEDDEEEVGVIAVQSAEPPGRRSSMEDFPASEESALEEDDDAGDESENVDEYVIESGGGDETGSDSPAIDSAIDAALRMNSLVAVAAEFAANV